MFSVKREDILRKAALIQIRQLWPVERRGICLSELTLDKKVVIEY